MLLVCALTHKMVLKGWPQWDSTSVSPNENGASPNIYRFSLALRNMAVLSCSMRRGTYRHELLGYTNYVIENDLLVGFYACTLSINNTSTVISLDTSVSSRFTIIGY